MAKIEHEFDYEYEETSYHVQMDFNLVHDSNYGADADGRRGTPMDFIEDLGFTILDANGVDVTERIEKEDPALYKAISDKADSEADEQAESYEDPGEEWDGDDDFDENADLDFIEEGEEE